MYLKNIKSLIKNISILLKNEYFNFDFFYEIIKKLLFMSYTIPHLDNGW